MTTQTAARIFLSEHPRLTPLMARLGDSAPGVIDYLTSRPVAWDLGGASSVAGFVSRPQVISTGSRGFDGAASLTGRVAQPAVSGIAASGVGDAPAATSAGPAPAGNVLSGSNSAPNRRSESPARNIDPFGF